MSFSTESLRYMMKTLPFTNTASSNGSWNVAQLITTIWHNLAIVVSFLRIRLKLIKKII